ncbi:flavin containing amine oxidoreductase domain-containing protein [Phthorimaea operculella]|nr:flavin containing amine oxidoreductase domain-containing protein [Phthorimaea operculella]
MISSWLGLFVILSAVLSVICSENQDNTNQYDTIVVGMGAAGTVAAATLARAGKSVLALEAQDRIGGRVYTVPFGDGVVEVGAEWIHGTEDSYTYKKAVENSIDILPDDLHYEVIYSDGSKASSELNEIIEYPLSLYSESKPSKPEPLGDLFAKKVTEYVKDKHPDIFENKKLLNRILDFIKQGLATEWNAYDSNDLNAADSHITLDGHQAMSWHRHGYKTFFDIMLNKYNNSNGLPTLNIKFNTEVTKIDWPIEGEGKVSVSTKDGTVYKAENVIVTISLGVLKERYKMLFSKPLPDKKTRAIEKLEMGLLGKIIFSFANAWWPNKNMFGFFWTEDDIKQVPAEDEWITRITEASPPMGSSNTLTVWTSGYVARQVENMPDDLVKTKIMGVLRRFMGANTTVPEPTAMIRSKWYTNEFTRGAYSIDSMRSADLPSARSDLGAPILDSTGKPRVLFAGEATHPTRFANVHGAADSGHREAMRLLRLQENS